jgi:hypothetical protein
MSSAFQRVFKLFFLHFHFVTMDPAAMDFELIEAEYA